jgi:hypothetical protein
MKPKLREVVVGYFSALTEHLKEKQSNATINFL